MRLGGEQIANAQANTQVGHDLARAELLAFPFIFLLSLLFFRSLVASLLPPLLGGLAIVATFFALRIVASFTDLSVFSLNFVTGLGLGLAIDYSLFMVSRYREEAARRLRPRGAAAHARRPPGRTILFSSLTVAAAVASLAIFPQRFLYSMGIAGAVVALVAATLALVVLPALLASSVRASTRSRPSGCSGRRTATRARRRAGLVPAVAVRDAPPGAYRRAERGVADRARDSVHRHQVHQRHRERAAAERERAPGRRHARARVPAEPNLAGRGRRRRPRRLSAGQGPGRADQPTAGRLRGRAGAAGRRRTTRCSPSRRRSGRSAQRPSSSCATSARSATPVYVGVAGQTAAFLDLEHSLGAHLPAVLAVIIAATLIVLFLFTGSVVLPIKAVLMNTLSLSAVLGILVLIFQDGRLQGLLSYTSQGALDATQPIFLAAVAFGLATDYGVFLLSRIKEARDSGVSDSEAVAVGLERSGRIITAAAVLFAVAIGAFATSKLVFIKELGLGIALAVLIDASIIRALLVPSLMELLGSWNWWAPRPLRRLHDRSSSLAPEPALETRK